MASVTTVLRVLMSFCCPLPRWIRLVCRANKYSRNNIVCPPKLVHTGTIASALEGDHTCKGSLGREEDFSWYWEEGIKLLGSRMSIKEGVGWEFHLLIKVAIQHDHLQRLRGPGVSGSILQAYIYVVVDFVPGILLALSMNNLIELFYQLNETGAIIFLIL